MRPGLTQAAIRLLLGLSPTSLPLPLSANNESQVQADAEPVHLYVTDPQGRHAGVDPVTGQIVDEIPGVAFSGSSGYPEALSIENFDSTWTVQVVGIQQGSYTLAATSINGAGTSTSITQDATAGQVDTFSVAPAPSGQTIDLTSNASPSPSPSPSPTPPPGSKGDTNCDGRIDGMDVMNVLDDAAGIGTPPACISNGDVDGDGQITAMDGLLILKYWAGLLNNFPAAGP